MTADSYDRIYQAVRRVPPGRVATYGQIAGSAGLGRHARLVGYALNACEDDVPWHRIVNSRGEISSRADPFYENLQRARLESEGVEFDARGRISLARFGWLVEGPLVEPDW